MSCVPDNFDIFDLSNVPEFFVSEVGKVETAGGGCVRVWNCVRRGKTLVPVCAIVIPIENLIIAGTEVRERAQDIFNLEQMHGLAS